MPNFMDITSQVSNFNGLVIVGDIHGNWSEFELVINRVKEENLFLLSVGDVMDYGFDNVKCFTELESLISTGQAMMLIGNHEFKLFKYINQSRENNIRLKRQGGILTTINELDELDEKERVIFEDQFLNRYRQSYYIVKYKDYYFTHGAMDPEFWGAKEFSKATRSMCMFGQVDHKATPTLDGFPVRKYDWVDSIPSDATVVVGHDIRSKSAPLNHKGKKGGIAIFLDTGSSKGGQLSSLYLAS